MPTGSATAGSSSALTVMADRGVHGLDPPEVGLDDFLTGRLPGSDGFGQLQVAHAPEVSGRDAHLSTPCTVGYTAAERSSPRWPRLAHQAHRWSTNAGSC
jgi:hypothetical protein